jgi:peptidyl-tRNA hydrolase
LGAFDQKDLQDLLAKAERLKLPVYLVGDRGQAAASVTDTLACIGIGPAPDAQIDELAAVVSFYRWVRENAVFGRVAG